MYYDEKYRAAIGQEGDRVRNFVFGEGTVAYIFFTAPLTDDEPMEDSEAMCLIEFDNGLNKKYYYPQCFQSGLIECI